MAWRRAEPITNFVQQEPANGESATERTEVRIVFDKDYLYIAADCLDANPSDLIANQLVRDGALDGDDRFAWVLDPYYNQRTGYFFEINPAGAMGDALLAPAQGSTFGAAQNRAWDGIWLARVRRHERGWSAEIQLPFKTLNFDPNASAWGANFQRTIRRKNEEAFWTGFARNEGLLTLAAEGRLVGITEASQGAGLDIKPYVLGTYKESPGRGVSSTTKGTGGLDLFYNLTPQLKANLTINTDFAQTEVDDRQVNLTRFPLFFPEKRDFFLEAAGNFDFSRENSNTITPFFSRRIGLDENGNPQKIDYGVKLSGQAGKYDLGLLQVRTARDHGLAGEDFTVFRPKRRFLTQSYVGAIYTRRAARESNASTKQTFGTDFELATNQFRGSQNLQFVGYFIKTPDPVKKGDDDAYGFRLNYPNDKWNARVVFRNIGANFDPSVGFIERKNYQKITEYVRFAPRPKNSRFIRQVGMNIFFDTFMDSDFRLLTRELRFVPLELTMQSGDTALFYISRWYDRPEEDFTISKGITLPREIEYRYTRARLTLTTANYRKVAVLSDLDIGGFYNGHRRDFSTTVTLRPRRGLSTALTGQFNRVELTVGEFSTRILRAVVNTQFNPWISVANNVQYDSVSRVLGWQFRFRWILQPGNDIHFVVLNNWLDTGTQRITLDRSATVKVSYTQRF
jgi:hypothetical protein